MEYSKKALPFLILRILTDYTDKKHYITQKDILSKLKQLYNFEAERKSISSNLKFLIEMGFDIVENKPKGGVSLISRKFDLTQVQYLIDSVFSSKSISGKHAKEIAESLSSNLSIYERRSYSYINKSEDINRSNNKEIFYNIELIHEAIIDKKQISFKYLTYTKDGKAIENYDGYLYRVNPYFLINNYGRYYLLCSYKKEYKLSVFRIDYMVNVSKTSEKMTPIEEIDSKYKNFSIAKYLNEHIYIFGGESCTARIEVLDEKAVKYIKDWFSYDTNFFTKDGRTYTDVTCNKNALIYWALQYGKYVKVIFPLDVVNVIKENIQLMLKNYSN